jgi:hypothetical protein
MFRMQTSEPVLEPTNRNAGVAEQRIIAIGERQLQVGMQAQVRGTGHEAYSARTGWHSRGCGQRGVLFLLTAFGLHNGRNAGLRRWSAFLTTGDRALYQQARSQARSRLVPLKLLKPRV